MSADAVALAAKLSQEVLAKTAAAADGEIRENKFPTESMQALQKGGLAGLLVPAGDGGAGADALTAVRVWEALAAGCANTALCHVTHSVASAALAKGAQAPVRADELAAVVKGEQIVALALSEPASGSRPLSPEVTFTRSPQGYALNGMKAFVSSALHADAFLISAAEKGSDKPTLFLLPAWIEGIQLYGEWHSLGMRGSMSINLRLQNATLEEKYRVGDDGAGQAIVDELIIPKLALGLAAVDVGIGQAALDATVKHVKQRRYSRGGGALSDVAQVRARLAEMYSSLEAARSLLHRAASALPEGAQSRKLVWSAKLQASSAARRVTELALETCGGRGYTQSLPVERHFRDARASAVIDPTSDWLAQWIGQALIK